MSKPRPLSAHRYLLYPGILWLWAACGEESQEGGTATTGMAAEASAGSGAEVETSSGSSTATSAETSSDITDTGTSTASASEASDASNQTDSETSEGSTSTDEGGTTQLCEQRCRLFEDDSCPAGQHCVPWVCDGSSVWDANVCVPNGELAYGAACDEEPKSLDPSAWCADDMQCVDGFCAQQCTGDIITPECPNDDPCWMDAEGDFAICLVSCDPLANECPEHLPLCLLNPANQADFYCGVYKGEADGGKQGMDCQDCRHCCQPGHLCLPAGQVKGQGCDEGECCSQYCDVNLAGDDCPLNHTCERVLSDDFPWHENVGVCTFR